jgi:hypothetical protein
VFYAVRKLLFPGEVSFMRTEENIFEDGAKTVHTFNDAGSCVQTTDYDAGGNIGNDIHYDVDPLQRVVGWKVFDANGNTIKRFEVDFDSQGFEIEVRQFGANGNLERLKRYLYDDNNRRIEEQHFDATRTLRSRKVFTSVGNETIAKYYDVQGNPLKGPAA